MTKNVFVFFILIMFVAAAAWFLIQKGKNVENGTNLSDKNPTAASTNTPTRTMRTLPSGLQIEDVVIGTGAEATAGKIVAVHYTGTFTNGQKFDSSVGRDPFQFIVGGGMVIRGWDEGIPGMKVGGKRKLIIPANLAYGEGGVPARDAQGRVIPNQYAIPPNSTLLFDVELLDVATPEQQ